MKWKKTIGKGAVTAAVLSFGMWVSADDASAHGYIQEPASRGYVGSLEKQVIGWQAAMEKHGRVIDSPQSVEGPKGFPERGPADGHIASAEGIKEYEIYRNGEKVATTMNTVYKDAGVKPDTSYEYYVKAIDLSGNTSSASKAVAVKTLKPVEDMEAPTPPSGLHSMKESESSIELMWSPSEDQVGVKEYAVYRDGQLVATTVTTYYIDKNLKPDTSYTYTVFAIDGAGNVSDSSSPLEVSTLKSDSSVEEWSEEKVYTAGMIVQFKGLEYKAKYWTKGNQPDSSDAWELVSDTVVEWNAQKAYLSGSKVNYGNRTYEARWWTLGDTPGTSVVWKVVE
ncbi:hypothetical protein A2U94_08455 [Bacillus sp. VT 712]|uniref:carbohydrate-binding protein n=1 Tax=Bacillaceae TaxID=186817 RepID=UPI0004731078|nr:MULTISPECIES: carbohydrate-binding protein [Bacillaceae]KZB91929.1 hypothetical protein A2U94_08455 [Bacillus sp. VT 712]